MNPFLLLSVNLVSLAFVVVGGILAYQQKEGWGWCFFLALITFSYFKGKTNEGEDEDE